MVVLLVGPGPSSTLYHVDFLKEVSMVGTRKKFTSKKFSNPMRHKTIHLYF